jgi:RNA polymerase sigma factor (sigma-70 family)
LSVIDKFIQDNYTELVEAAKKISGNDPLWEDLLHYTLEEFLTKPNVEDIVNSGGARFYCVRIMMNSFRSTTSPFYHTYRKPSVDLHEVEDLPVEEDQTPELAARIRHELLKLPWYDRMLMEVFVDEGHTVSSLSRSTGIPRTSISLSINRIRRHIKRII